MADRGKRFTWDGDELEWPRQSKEQTGKQKTAKDKARKEALVRDRKALTRGRKPNG